MPEYRFPLSRIYLYKEDSALAQENTGQRKPVLWHILCSSSIFNSFSSRFIPLFVTVSFCFEFIKFCTLEKHCIQVFTIIFLFATKFIHWFHCHFHHFLKFQIFLGIISPYQQYAIQTLLFKLFDKLIRLELVEDSQTLSSSTNQSFK